MPPPPWPPPTVAATPHRGWYRHQKLSDTTTPSPPRAAPLQPHTHHTGIGPQKFYTHHASTAGPPHQPRPRTRRVPPGPLLPRVRRSVGIDGDLVIFLAVALPLGEILARREILARGQLADGAFGADGDGGHLLLGLDDRETHLAVL